MLSERIPRVENQSIFTASKNNDRQKNKIIKIINNKIHYYKINTFIAALGILNNNNEVRYVVKVVGEGRRIYYVFIINYYCSQSQRSLI